MLSIDGVMPRLAAAPGDRSTCELGGDVDRAMAAVGDDTLAGRRPRGARRPPVAANTTAGQRAPPAACRRCAPSAARRSRGRPEHRPRSGQPRASRGCGARRTVAAPAAPSRRGCRARPDARRSSSSTARASSNRSITACESDCRGERRHRLRQAPTSDRCRRRGRARSSGTGTPCSQRAPSSAMSVSSRCVACTAVKRSVSAPWRAEQRGRRAPVRGEALLVLGRLLGDVGVQRQPRVGSPGRDRCDRLGVDAPAPSGSAAPTRTPSRSSAAASARRARSSAAAVAVAEPRSGRSLSGCVDAAVRGSRCRAA